MDSAVCCKRSPTAWTATDAEDIVQEAWLRWNRVDAATVDDPTAYLSTAAKRRCARRLENALYRLGVEVRTGATAARVLPGAVELEDGERIPTDVTLRTTGVAYSPLAAEAGITVDATGRVTVDAALRSVSHPEIFAIGDAAAVRQADGVIHGTCQSGIPTAAHTAESITRVLHGKEPRPFRFGYLYQPVSLGRKDAVIQFTNPNDTPSRWYLKGRAAIAYKEAVSSSPLKVYRSSTTIPARMTGRTGGRCNRLDRATVSPASDR